MGKVIFLNNTDSIPKNIIESLYLLTPKSRRAKVDMLASFSDKANSILAYHILSILLEQTYNISQPNIVVGIDGKPRLKNNPNIYFSISHNGNCVCCAVDDKPIGIDVQKVKSYDDSMAKYICSNEEYSTLQQDKAKCIMFTKLWCKKESILKLHGNVLNVDMKNLEAEYDDYIFSYLENLNKNYIIAVCETKDITKKVYNKCGVSNLQYI